MLALADSAVVAAVSLDSQWLQWIPMVTQFHGEGKTIKTATKSSQAA